MFSKIHVEFFNIEIKRSKADKQIKTNWYAPDRNGLKCDLMQCDLLEKQEKWLLWIFTFPKL